MISSITNCTVKLAIIIKCIFSRLVRHWILQICSNWRFHKFRWCRNNNCLAGVATIETHYFIKLPIEITQKMHRSKIDISKRKSSATGWLYRYQQEFDDVIIKGVTLQLAPIVFLVITRKNLLKCFAGKNKTFWRRSDTVTNISENYFKANAYNNVSFARGSITSFIHSFAKPYHAHYHARNYILNAGRTPFQSGSARVIYFFICNIIWLICLFG